VEKTDSDVPIGCPKWQSSRAIKVLLDQIHEDGLVDKQSDEAPHQADSGETEPESDSNHSSEEEPVIPVVAPVLQPKGRKKVIGKVVDAGNVLDDDDGMHLICIHSYNLYLTYMLLSTVPFTIFLEVENLRKGSCSIEAVSSDIPWVSLQERLAKALDIYPSSLQVQYRLSTQPKALPLDLQCKNDMEMMFMLVQPLVVPPLLASGCRSTRTMKHVTIQIFNKGDTVPILDKVHYSGLFPPLTSHNELDIK
jgi:hypothetical protein